MAVNKIFGKAFAKGPSQGLKGKEMLAQSILEGLQRDLKSLHVPGAEHVGVEIEVNADFGDFLVADAGDVRGSNDG